MATSQAQVEYDEKGNAIPVAGTSSSASPTSNVEYDEKGNPIAPNVGEPSAFTHFGESASNTTPLSFLTGKDISEYPSAIKQMIEQLSNGPIPEIGGAARALNIPYNIIKGAADSSADTRANAAKQFSQPGIINKAGAATKYAIGSVPFIGPSLVTAMNQADSHDISGMLGTMSGLGIQAFLSNPEASAPALSASWRYLFSKPEVQEHMLAQEVGQHLNQVESNVRAHAHDMYPEDPDPTTAIPAGRVASIAQNAIDKNIKGSYQEPTPLKSMTEAGEGGGMRRYGVIDQNGSPLEIFTRMRSDTPMTSADVHGFYTELGDKMSSGRLPGDVYNAYKQARIDLGKEIENMYHAESPEALLQFQAAQANWADTADRLWNPASPIAQARDGFNQMRAGIVNPEDVLKPLTGKQAKMASDILSYYSNHGGDPDFVKSANTFYKGVDALTSLRVYRSAPVLGMFATLKAAGLSYPEAILGAVGPRLGWGYAVTRPSFAKLLADATPTKFNPVTAEDIAAMSNRINGPNSPGGPAGPTPSPRVPPIRPSPINQGGNAVSPTNPTNVSTPDLNNQREVMVNTQPTSRATPTATRAGSSVLPAILKMELERQAGRSLTDDEAIALDRANLERGMTLTKDTITSVREAHRAKLEKAGR